MQENSKLIAISEHGIIKIHDESLLELIWGAGASAPGSGASAPGSGASAPGSGASAPGSGNPFPGWVGNVICSKSGSSST